MSLVASPKELLQTWTIKAQLVFAAVSALLVAVWGVLKMYPETAAKWAAWLGLPAESPTDLAEQLLVASLIVNVATPIITTFARAWKQNLSWAQAQALPPESEQA